MNTKNVFILGVISLNMRMYMENKTNEILPMIPSNI
jgi:hypothetical protein